MRTRIYLTTGQYIDVNESYYNVWKQWVVSKGRKNFEGRLFECHKRDSQDFVIDVDAVVCIENINVDDLSEEVKK